MIKINWGHFWDRVLVKYVQVPYVKYEGTYPRPKARISYFLLYPLWRLTHKSKLWRKNGDFLFFIDKNMFYLFASRMTHDRRSTNLS